MEGVPWARAGLARSWTKSWLRAWLSVKVSAEGSMRKVEHCVIAPQALYGAWLPHIGQTYAVLDVSRIDTLECCIQSVLGSRVWIVNLTLLGQG